MSRRAHQYCKQSTFQETQYHEVYLYAISFRTTLNPYVNASLSGLTRKQSGGRGKVNTYIFNDFVVFP